MGYASYITELLRPLGIYTFRAGSVSGSEIESIGAALDECARDLAEKEREALVATAEAQGLAQMEALFAHRPAAGTVSERRAAIAALVQISGGDFTRAAIDRALRGCGIRAEVTETEEAGCVRVTFPETAGVPEEFDRMRTIILDIIPCHLETEFYFRYLTWVELEARFPTWSSIEEGNYTWEALEVAV